MLLENSIGIKFFWWICVITPTPFDLEWLQLARPHTWRRFLFLHGQSRPHVKWPVPQASPCYFVPPPTPVQIGLEWPNLVF